MLGQRRSALIQGLFALVIWALILGCGQAEQSLGEGLEPSRAVSVATVLAREDPGTLVVVSGRVGEVCRTAGCWFVLEESVGGETIQLLVDLKGCASFTVPVSIQGRQALVQGRISGKGPDRQLCANGIVLR